MAIRKRLMRNWRSWNGKTPFLQIIWECSKTLTLKSRSSWTKLIPLWRNSATRPENVATTREMKSSRAQRYRRESVCPELWPTLFPYVLETNEWSFFVFKKIEFWILKLSFQCLESPIKSVRVECREYSWTFIATAFGGGVVFGALWSHHRTFQLDAWGTKLRKSRIAWWRPI